MRILIINVILICALQAVANDSLNIKSSNKKWQIEILGNYNYNYRKTGEIKETLILQNDRDAINNYIDTGNIACYTKNVGILISRKIWKPLSFQFGIIYGRKGYMHTRQLVAYQNGKGGFTGTYIKAIPEKMIIIPLKLNFTIPILNQHLIFGASVGFDFNFGVNNYNSKESYYYYFNESYLRYETSGFFGFKPVNRLSPNTKLLHEGGTMPFLQYNLGLFLKVKLFKSWFTCLKYNYISQLRYFETTDYDVYIPKIRNHFKYEVKPYIHSFGIGLGFEF